MQPIQDDTKRALATTMEQKPAGMMSFLQTGLDELGKEANHTIDFLFGRKGPGSSMITRDLSEYEKKLIASSEDTVV